MSAPDAVQTMLKPLRPDVSLHEVTRGSHPSRVSAQAALSSNQEKAGRSRKSKRRSQNRQGSNAFAPRNWRRGGDCALHRRQPRYLPQTAKPDPVRPHRSGRTRPDSQRAPFFRSGARAPARAHAPIRFGNSKPGLRGSARSALASFANAPVWRSVFGSKVSHGPTT